MGRTEMTMANDKDPWGRGTADEHRGLGDTP
jgi:hypothetical protein